MRKKIVYSWFLFFLCVSVHSQNDRQLRIQAMQAIADKDWFSASQYYARMYGRDSSSIKLKYNYAEASRLNFDFDLAIRLYSQVILEDNGKKYPLSYYWMGQLLKGKMLYKEAKKWFTKYSKHKKKSGKNDDYYLAKTKLEIEACNFAQIMIKNPAVNAVEHLDKSINSKVSEFAAFEKDNILYFSSLRDGTKKDGNEVNLNKIYQSENKDGNWKKVVVLDTNINATYLHNANTCFSPDYKKMIVSRCKTKNASEYQCDLYIGVFVNNKWQPFEKLPSPINMSGVSTSQPCFGEIDGNTVLFFSSDRAGGEGGMDIWWSVLNADGGYEEPINAGKLVNTADDEITPWFVNKTKTLFFSSTYHQGFGGFDIFKSQYLNKAFSSPQNVGYPINSSYNDIYCSVNKSGDRVYLSSNRLGSFFENKLNCCNDIYRFKIDPLAEPAKPIDSLDLVKGQMKLLVPLTLYFHNDEPDPKTKNTVTATNYETSYNAYKTLLPIYNKEFSSELKGKEKERAIVAIDNFFVDSVDAGIEDLTKFSDLLKKVLTKGQSVRITMKGYCSPLASTDYNINLAKRRISSLRNYFSETNNGYFVPYINNKKEAGAKIIFEDVEIGELPASKTSDNYKDKKNSIYSPSAASERKIQIIAVSFN